MPSAHHVLQGAAALLAAHPPTDEKAYRPRLISGDVCVGCIVWLPPRKDHEPPILCKREGCCGGEVLQDEGYNHPVVVLKIRQSENSRVHGDLMCLVACITTFSDTPLPAYFKKRKRRRHYQASIPIIQSSNDLMTSVDTWSLKRLVLEDGTLRKQSYVRLEHTYEVAVSMLAQYSWRSSRAYKKRLSNSSYDLLMTELGLVPEVFEETGTLYETESRRLSALANPITGLPNAIHFQSIRALPPPQPQTQLINQLFPAHDSHASIPAAGYHDAIPSTRTPPHFASSHTYIPLSSSPPESSDEIPISSLFKYFLGAVVVGSCVWWMYYR